MRWHPRQARHSVRRAWAASRFSFAASSLLSPGWSPLRRVESHPDRRKVAGTDADLAVCAGARSAAVRDASCTCSLSDGFAPDAQEVRQLGCRPPALSAGFHLGQSGQEVAGLHPADIEQVHVSTDECLDLVVPELPSGVGDRGPTIVCPAADRASPTLG
jgi:hypothetical protein